MHYSFSTRSYSTQPARLLSPSVVGSAILAFSIILITVIEATHDFIKAVVRSWAYSSLYEILYKAFDFFPAWKTCLQKFNSNLLSFTKIKLNQKRTWFHFKVKIIISLELLFIYTNILKFQQYLYIEVQYLQMLMFYIIATNIEV